MRNWELSMMVVKVPVFLYVLSGYGTSQILRKVTQLIIFV